MFLAELSTGWSGATPAFSNNSDFHGNVNIREGAVGNLFVHVRYSKALVDSTTAQVSVDYGSGFTPDNASLVMVETKGVSTGASGSAGIVQSVKDQNASSSGLTSTLPSVIGGTNLVLALCAHSDTGVTHTPEAGWTEERDVNLGTYRVVVLDNQTQDETMLTTWSSAGAIHQTLIELQAAKQISYYTGAVWTQKPLKYYDGATWQTSHELFRWNGTQWDAT
jgi:hypothetical protein